MTSRVLIAMLAAATTLGAPSGAVGSRASDRVAVRKTVNRYLAAVNNGHPSVACALLSLKGMRNAGYRTRRACAADLREARGIGLFHVVKVTFRDRRHADAEINDARVSDSGNDVIAAGKYGGRWLIDAG